MRETGGRSRTTNDVQPHNLLRLIMRDCRSFSLKVDDVGINHCGVVQQVVVLAFEVLVKEREDGGSYRLALSPGSEGGIAR